MEELSAPVSGFTESPAWTVETRRFIGYGGITLVADLAGPEGGQPVLLLHGGGQTRHSWGTALRALAGGGYRAIALDARGHGESSWAADGNYSLGAFAADLGFVMADLPRQPAIVGASLGGLAALLFVGQNLHLAVRSLILVDIVPRVDAKGVSRIDNFMSANPKGFATVEEAAGAVAKYLPHRERPQDISRLRRNLRQAQDGRYYWHWDPRMLVARGNLQGEIRENVETAASRIRIPTLLIRGEYSEIVTGEGVAAFRALMPHSEYIDVKGARHMVAGDENNAFNGALIEFLERTAPAQKPGHQQADAHSNFFGTISPL